MIRKALSVLAFASVSAVAAHAQAAAPAAAVKPITFGIKAGGSIPVSDFSNSYKTGYLLGGQIGLATPALPVTFRIDADFSQYEAKGISLKGQIWGFTGNVLYDLPTMATIKPYAIAGLGMYTTKSAGPSDNNFGFNVGGGIKVPLAGFNTFVEARYTRVNGSNGNNALQYVPVYVGVSF